MIILHDTFGIEIFLTQQGPTFPFSKVDWMSLQKHEIEDVADTFNILAQGFFALRWVDLDWDTINWMMAVMASWLIAIVLFGANYLWQYATQKFRRWWTFCLGRSRFCGKSRVPAKRNRPPRNFHGRTIIFGWLIVSTSALEPLTQCALRGDTWDPAESLSGISTIPEPGISSNIFGMDPNQNGDFTNMKAPMNMERVRNRAYYFIPDINMTFSRTLTGRPATITWPSRCMPSPDFCAKLNSEDTQVSKRDALFDSLDAYATPWPSDRREKVESTGLAWDQFDATFLMQRPILTRGEVCGDHADPLIYWDRLSYRPPIINTRFYIWRTMPDVGRLQHDLHLVSWDGTRCVRCSAMENPRLGMSVASQGPYYLRPQPVLVEGNAILHFIMLVAPKIPAQRAVHLTVRTPSGRQHGTIILNTLTGIMHIPRLFDLVAPSHNCRTSSWCRVQHRAADRINTWWFPGNFLLLDLAHLELDEFESQNRQNPFAVAGSPSQAYVCQEMRPDSGTTDYETEPHSLLNLRLEKKVPISSQEDLRDGDEPDTFFAMHVSTSASRSRTNSPEHSSEDTDTDTHDALVVYGLTIEFEIIPVDENTSPDFYRAIVSNHFDLRQGSIERDKLSVHPIRPKPSDLADCITPIVAVFEGHVNEVAHVLVDTSLHSNSRDACGEQEQPYTLREVHRVPTTITRATLLFQLGLRELCQNIALPCLVQFGDRPWVQQDPRPQTVLNGLLIRIDVPIARPTIPLSIYLTYSREGIRFGEMEDHWHRQVGITRERLNQMFPSDDERLIPNDERTGELTDTDVHSLVVVGFETHLRSPPNNRTQDNERAEINTRDDDEAYSLTMRVVISYGTYM